MFHIRFEERFALEKDADGSGPQLPGPEAVRQVELINAKCENISCCTSVAYVDSRKRVAGSDSDFEDLGESLRLQSDARLAVYKIRLADSFVRGPGPLPLLG